MNIIKLIRKKVFGRIALDEKRDAEIRKKWYEEARRCRLDDGSLLKFMKRLVGKYEHDYGTIVHAMTAAAIAGAYAVEHSPQGGITGFQHSCFIMEFLAKEQFSNNKFGFFVRDVDDILYPQYQEKFCKLKISSKTADKIRQEAKMNLANKNNGVPPVRDWWQRLADGNFPEWVEIEEWSA